MVVTKDKLSQFSSYLVDSIVSQISVNYSNFEYCEFGNGELPIEFGVFLVPIKNIQVVDQLFLISVICFLL